MYRHGRGVVQSDKGAVAWYRKDADQIYVLAQCGLGLMCAKGQGVVQSDEEAAAWYHKASDQGNAQAQCYLGVIFH